MTFAEDIVKNTGAHVHAEGSTDETHSILTAASPNDFRM